MSVFAVWWGSVGINTADFIPWILLALQTIMVYFWQIKKKKNTKNAPWNALKSRWPHSGKLLRWGKWFCRCSASGKVITYLHNCTKALQDWHATGGEERKSAIAFARVIKKDIKIEVFYLKVWIALLNEMLHLLFMARRHLAGYFLLVQPRLCESTPERRDLHRSSVLDCFHLFKWISYNAQ